MNKNVRVLGRKHSKPINIPASGTIPRVDFGNCLIHYKTGNNWENYIGWGKVLKVYKCDDFDVAYVDFGAGSQKATRVFFHSLMSRKQVYTLMTGQFAMFGLVKRKGARDNTYLDIWCMGIYVPKIVDIRKSELEEDEFETMAHEDYEEGKTFLDFFKKND